MCAKRYVSADGLTRDSFRLARRVLDSGWRPDVMVTLWRGGAPVGIALHEFFNYLGCRTEHVVVKCASYTGIGKSGVLRAELTQSALRVIRKERRVLLVDDIFDTGKTAMHMRRKLTQRGAQVRIATLYWKPSNNRTSGRPDYFI
ncbi:MAG: phosphoribosyltransferase family protein, partial [Kiritimatiellae bacterium]|nr:phosphoribosyltransferase family protein [Kiritimatiellia bacterium]